MARTAGEMRNAMRSVQVAVADVRSDPAAQQGTALEAALAGLSTTVEPLRDDASTDAERAEAGAILGGVRDSPA